MSKNIVKIHINLHKTVDFIVNLHLIYEKCTFCKNWVKMKNEFGSLKHVRILICILLEL